MFSKSARVCGQLLWDLRGLKSVVISEGTDKVGSHWFCYSGVESVEIPASVREIGHEAFCGCKRLVRLVFKRATAENSNAEGSSGLKLLFSSGKRSKLRVIGRRAFCDCCSLGGVCLPDGLKEIGLCAFSVSGIESFVVPGSLQTILQGAFAGCERLRAARLNEGLRVLGTDEQPEDERLCRGVFEGSALEHIELPSSLRSIEYAAFRDCESLKSIQLPLSLKRVEARMFAGCKNLKAVDIPKNVTYVGEACFSGSGVE